MSKEDIEKGSRGLEELGKALEATSVGIICLTPENVEKPWILFESGALSKAMGDQTRVCPYLFGGLLQENVKPPLGMFQATKALKDDTRKLVGTINRVLGSSLTDEKLDTLFERMWPVLEAGLEAVPIAGAAAAPQRTEKEMLAELLELARVDATVVNTNNIELMIHLIEAVEEIREAVKPRLPLSALAGGTLAAWLQPLNEIVSASAAGPERASPEERAERARLINRIRGHMKQEKEAGAPQVPDPKKKP